MENDIREQKPHMKISNQIKSYRTIKHKEKLHLQS